jgi:phage terminase large subunit-like protein
MQSTINYMDTAESYMSGVEDGSIEACNYIKQAVKRTRSMFDDDRFYFDAEKAVRPVQFARFCRHLKGPLAGEPIVLEPWQVFIIVSVYGFFRKSDDRRVVRTVYIEVPRKNGKSTLLSVLALYHLIADGEASAEVYSAAVSRDQAKIVFGDAQAMVRGSPDLRTMLTNHRNVVSHDPSNSKFEALSADAGSLEGKNPSFSVVDEVHVHKTPDVWDVLNVAAGARAQPLIVGITTAGTNKEGIAYQLRDYVEKLLNGTVEDPTFFGVIYTMDHDDDWRDPSVWRKANPNYGVSVQPDDLDRLFLQANESPSAETNFRTKRLNEWMNATSAWLKSTDWEACDTELPPIEEFEGQPCYLGLDLASVSDFACVAALFPQPPYVYVYLKSYLPLDTIQDKGGHMAHQYRKWMEQENLVATDGNVTDLAYIKDQVLSMCEKYNVREIAFDPYGANELSASLIDKGLPMIKFGQGILSMSGPSKSFEKLVKAGHLVHGNDPILTWMASNAVVYNDPNDNIKVKKDTDAAKIDGIIAAIMALGRLEVNGGLVENPYSKRGIRTIN